MDKVRVGVVGVGNMGTTHVKLLMENKIENAVLTAICDRNEKKIEAIKEKFKDDPRMQEIACFTNADDLIASGKCDLVTIAVPHYDHPTIAIKVLKAGLHVMVEKPAGVYTKQVKEMIEEAKKRPDQIFGIMFNQRTNPYFKKMREIIASGELGEVRRTNWIITNWYRAQIYYDSGDWRATWAGEGGGVLMNQSPHNIDLFWWITGMVPTKVRAFCHFGKWHNIEVEDDVTAYFEYENGATGCFITSTADAPGTNRFEITCSKGKMVYENKKIMLTRLEEDLRDYTFSTEDGMGKPASKTEEIVLDEPNPQHAGILNNIANAILKIEPLYARGEEGINGVQIANGMLLSAWLGKEVSIPLDDDLYYEELQKRVKTSKKKENVKEVVTNLDGTY